MSEDEGTEILLVINWFALTANSREHTGFILFCGTQKLQYLSGTLGFILFCGTQKLQYSSALAQCTGIAIFIWHAELLSVTWFTETTIFMWYGGLHSVCTPMRVHRLTNYSLSFYRSNSYENIVQYFPAN
jgi:hypothetical protein